ncbi:hypothetical protein LZ554_000404 [Drepanopeziza brunnea f. sp. 'monogermtubi']|nr:hypothetical protein LZ554_000404 [Drepanopeziza brunnea f. sp. 'monogermtubi']
MFPSSLGLLACLAFSQLIPSASSAAAQVPLYPTSHTEGYKFDPLHHLPGISPYFDAIGFGLDHGAPRHCEVTAASYLIRHAAIYANEKDYQRYIEPFLKKLDSTYAVSSRKKREGWRGPLAFFDKWKTPIDDNRLEEITPQGIKDSKKVGKHLLSRYPTLVPTTKRIFADTKSRTQDTAAAFVKVFPQKVEIEEISSNRSSFYSQNPHKACDAFSKKPGDKEMNTFMSRYTAPIIARLQRHSPVDLTETDIMGLQQLCGYESAITGKKSDTCDVFTDDEWMSYEYAWDLKYSYMLMEKFHSPRHRDTLGGEIPDDDGQRFFLAFTHREVPPFIATALGLFNSSNALAEEFPTDRINWNRSWKMAELIPFLGHVGIEKLTCNSVSAEPADEQEYIRVIANSAPRPIPGCEDGPGASCKVDQFVEKIRRGMEEYGDFEGVCGNDKE